MKKELEMETAERAAKFLLSLRGRILLGQALTHGIEQMSQVPAERREISNIEDMKYLLENFALVIE